MSIGYRSNFRIGRAIRPNGGCGLLHSGVKRRVKSHRDLVISRCCCLSWPEPGGWRLVCGLKRPATVRPRRFAGFQLRLLSRSFADVTVDGSIHRTRILLGILNEIRILSPRIGAGKGDKHPANHCAYVTFHRSKSRQGFRQPRREQVRRRFSVGPLQILITRESHPSVGEHIDGRTRPSQSVLMVRGKVLGSPR